MKATPLMTGQISAWQLGLLLVTGAVITDSTIGNAMLTHALGQDLWLAWALGLPLGVAGVWAAAALGARYAGRNLVEILVHLLGPFAYPLVVAYLALFTADMALSLREDAYLSLPLLPATPPSVLIIPWVLLAMYASYLGIEVLARLNAFILLCVDIPLGIVLTFALLPQHTLAYLSPVFVHQWPTVLSAARFSAGSWGAMVAMLLFTNVVGDVGRMPKVVLYVVGISVIIGIGHDLGPVLTFGPAAGSFSWPTFEEVRAVEFGRFVERVDIIAIVLWVHGYWAKLALLMQAVTVGTARLVGLRSYRWLIPAVGALALGLAFFPAPHMDVDRIRRWQLNGWPMLVLGLILPLLLLAWSRIRDGRGAPSRTPRTEAPAQPGRIPLA